jgi:DNA-binding CsgD family transcriptional regulator
VRDALDLVALAEPVPVSRLVNLVEDGVLDQLAHEGLIVLGHSGRPEEGLSPTVRVAHPMYGEAVRRLVPLDRRRRLYAAMRTARTTAGGLSRETSASLLRSVVWALECGIRETPGRLLEGMAIATALNRPDVTVQIGFVALDELPPQHPDRADVLLLRANAWRLLDQPARALRDLGDVSQLLGPPEEPVMRERHVRLTTVRADVDQYHGDDVEAALIAIDRLRAAVPGAGPDGLPVLELERLVHLGRAGRFTECLEPALVLLRAAEQPSTELLRLANPMVFGLGQAGRFGEAVQLAERSTRAATAQGQQVPWLAAEIEMAHFLVRLWAGEVETAIELLHPHDDTWAHHTSSDSFGNLGRGLIASAYGRWSDAQRELRVACARYAVLDPAGVFAYAVAAQAVATAAVGDLTRARELIEVARETPLRMSAVIESDVRLQVLDAMAWLRQPALHGEAMLLARWCAERGLHRTELSALHRAILAGHLRGAAAPTDAAVLARMRELGAHVDSPRAAALLEHAAAVVAGDEQLVQMASRRLGQCGLWLPMVGQSSALTRREREIAGLAAGGLSSRAIAERLTVSVRTVDSHLSRVFTKLGLRSRQDLGAALRGQV